MLQFKPLIFFICKSLKLFFIKQIVLNIKGIKNSTFISFDRQYFCTRFLKIKEMAKYSKKAGEKVEKAMHEMKEGTLKTGSGKKVTSKKQAVAIGLSEAKEAGAKVPKKKSSKK